MAHYQWEQISEPDIEDELVEKPVEYFQSHGQPSVSSQKCCWKTRE
jgi:hypothetical protein